jgi:hypothetical protein
MQALVESLLKEYPNILILRVRMPICEDLTYPRNFIAKIIKYDKVCARSHQLQIIKKRFAFFAASPHLKHFRSILVVHFTSIRCYESMETIVC